MEKGFEKGVAKKLKHYVYRLVDPRNGNTFYVGKGKDDRIFQHANNVKIEASYEDGDLKLKTIQDIKNAGLEVVPIIHRYGMKDEETAFEVESALIAVYPIEHLSNKISGRGDDKNNWSPKELNDLYAMKEMDFNGDKCVIIKHKRQYWDNSLMDGNDEAVYNGTRYCWVANKKRAEETEYVIATVGGVGKKVYKPTRWEQFSPGVKLPDGFEGIEPHDIYPEVLGKRIGFIGDEVQDKDVLRRYVNRRIPEFLNKRGAMNPFLYNYDQGGIKEK